MLLTFAPPCAFKKHNIIKFIILYIKPLIALYFQVIFYGILVMSLKVSNDTAQAALTYITLEKSRFVCKTSNILEYI